MSKRDKLSPEMRAATERALAPDQLPTACLERDCSGTVQNPTVFWLGDLRITVGACESHNADFLRRVARIGEAMEADPSAGKQKLHGLLNSDLNLNLPPLHEMRLSAGYVTRES